MPKKSNKPSEPKVKQFRAKKVPNAYVISQYYGFDAIDLPEVIKEDRDHAKKVSTKSNYEHEDLPTTEEKIALLRGYRLRNFEHKKPVMLYCEGVAKGAKRKAKRGEKLLHLHIIGTPKSIAEAQLIRTAMCVLQEEGYKDMSVEINNVGGKEALPNFLRELTAYYRKHINDMDTECRQLFKDGSHSLVSCGSTLKKEVKDNAPSPFNYLTDENRNHLKEVVEYMDEAGIPYDVNKDILGNPNFSTDTVFTIINKKTGEVLATGSRYNQLAKKTVQRKGIDAVGITIKLKKTKEVALSQVPKSEEVSFFFVQLGALARRKSLGVLLELRKEKIKVFNTLSQDKLGDQLAEAKRKGVPYALILGQKEAHEGTIVIRDLVKHSQVIIPQSNLIKHIKKLSK